MEANELNVSEYGQHSCAACFFFPHFKNDRGYWTYPLAGVCRLLRRHKFAENGASCKSFSKWTEEKQLNMG